MNSDNDATAAPPKEVPPPPRREGEERKGGERNDPVKASGCGYSSDESDEDYGTHEVGVAFMRGECHNNPRKTCVCGGCIMIDKFRLKLHFARHEYELKKLKEEIEELKKTK